MLKIKFLLFLLVTSLAYSQNTNILKGKILDENNVPMPNVNVFLKYANKGTITNKNGEFILIISELEKDEVLRATCVGYESYSLKINSNTPPHVLINMKQADILLSEVIVSNLSAQELVKKATSKIPQNYSQKEFLSKMFYRAWIKVSPDSLLYVEETAFSQLKSYNPKFKDKMFLDKNRNFNFHENSKVVMRGIGNVDYVKEFSLKNKENYKNKFSYKTPTVYDGQKVYVVAINEGADSINDITGNIYINVDDLAFVRFDLKENGKHHIVQYRQINGYYYLVTSNITIHNPKLNGGYFETSSQMTLTEIKKTFNSDDVKGIYVRNEDVMQEYAIQNNDVNFWEEHNQILPDTFIQEKVLNYILHNSSSHTDKSIIDKDKRLYSPNITLRLSSFFPNDIDILAKNISSINTYTNYSFNKSLNNGYLSLFLSAVTNCFLISTLEQVEAERKLLSISHINAKINPSPFNALNESYHYGLTLDEMNLFKTDNYINFMRLHTIRDEYQYIKSKNIEEQIAKVDLHNRNNKYDYLLFYFTDFLYNRFSNIYFSPLKDISQNGYSKKTPLIVDRNKSWVKYLFSTNQTFDYHITSDELNKEEENFLKRSYYLSWLNFVSPQLFGIGKFKINDNLKFTFSLGHLRLPFGEQTEQNIWFSYNDILSGFFVRQYINHEKTNWGLGYKLYDLNIGKEWRITSTIDYWAQPQNLQFYDKNIIKGFHVGQELEWKLRPDKFTKLYKYSLYFGYDFKTKGYMPENIIVNQHFKAHIGTRINF